MEQARHILYLDAQAATGYLPRFFGALLIMVVGTAIAWVLGRCTSLLLSKIGLDALGERTGLTEDLATIGVRAAPSRVIGTLIFWIVFVAMAVQAVDTLGLQPISSALNGLLMFLPHVALAAIIVIAGIVFANIISRNTAARMSQAGVLYHPVAATAIRGIIITLSLLMALEQLTIASTFLFYVLLVLLGGFALAGGIALGWGSRTLTENLVAGRYVESRFSVGQRIQLNGTAGTIERIGPTSVVVGTSEGRHVVLPNAMLSRYPVETMTLDSTEKTSESS